MTGTSICTDQSKEVDGPAKEEAAIKPQENFLTKATTDTVNSNVAASFLWT